MSDRLSEIEVRKALLVGKVEQLIAENQKRLVAKRDYVAGLEDSPHRETHARYEWELYGIKQGLERALEQIERYV